MRFLLDTHAFPWYFASDPRLGRAAEQAISNSNNTIFISIATPWEIAIKVSSGKLILAEPFQVIVPREIAKNNFQFLAATLDHLAVVASLPFPTKHRDPFDRLLVAQAMAEMMPILSADASLDAYGVARIW